MSGAISFGAGGTGSALLPSNLGVKSAAASTAARSRVGSSSLTCRAMSARPETFLIEQSFGPTPKDSLRARFERMIFEAQDAICAAVEEMDGGAKFVEDVHFKPKMTDFTKAGTEGGGATRVLQDGNVWEKAGVSVSTNAGLMTPDIYRSANPEYEVFKKGLVPFFAVGISSVMHPKNPFAPTVHFNYRFFETNCPKDDLGTPNKWWFGGGTDLTPSYLIEEDVKHFHAVQKQACDKFDTSLYPKFKKTCDDYFFIPHRGERRGLGGIFYEDLHDRDQEILFELAKELSSAVIPAYLPIIEKRKDMPYSDKHKSWQQQRRGRYVEFNLVYDRGTVFGMKTKARMESVLMSLPLTARWEYNQHPEEGSEEWKLLDACINPKEWV